MELGSHKVEAPGFAVKTNPDSKPELRIYRVGDTVKTNGTAYKILDREKDVITAGNLDDRPNVPAGFEVWQVKTLKSDKKTPWGTNVPAGTEVLPSTSDWGVSGWTYTATRSDRATALKATRRRVQWLLDGREPENIGPILRAIFAKGPRPTGQSRPAAPKRPIK